MTTLFIILIVLASAILALIVLVQNPKGGGLTGNIAGFSNQFMGVKQTTDVLEKGTWLFAGLIAALSMFSVIFLSKGSTAGTGTPDRTIETKSAPIPSTGAPTTIPSNATPIKPVTPSGAPATTPNK
jgi:preprotein translocase subunit SecG